MSRPSTVQLEVWLKQVSARAARMADQASVMSSAIGEVFVLHQGSSAGQCVECAQMWPCRTINRLTEILGARLAEEAG